VRGQRPRPGRSLSPGKSRYQLYRRLGGAQGRSGQVRKISPPPGFDSRTVQPVACRYPTHRGMEVRFRKCNIRINKVICAWTWLHILNCTSFHSILCMTFYPANSAWLKIGLTFLKLHFRTFMKICREGTSDWWIHTFTHSHYVFHFREI